MLGKEVAVPMIGVIGVLQVREIRHRVRPGPGGVERNPSYAALGFKQHGIILGPAVSLSKTRSGKLWKRAAALRERGRARRRLVEGKVVVQMGIARADIGEPQPYVVNLPLDGDVELLDPAVLCVQRIAGDALRRNTACAGRERVRKLK